MDFIDKVVLVTGASSGIGRAIAEKFAAHRATVVLHYHRNQENAQTLLNALPGDAHIALQADLTDPDSVSTLVQKTMDTFGKIDILINNAGIFELHSIFDISYQDWQAIWQKTIAANLLGPAYLTFCVIGNMLEQGGGSIINISSRGAFRGEPEAPAYGASKAGLNAFSQSMAKALAAKKIYVYALAPGFVDTERVAPILNGPNGDAVKNQSPMGRVARPDEVAHTALFLASEGSEYLTGSIVDINGASYLRT